MILTYGSRDTVAGVWCEKFCQEQGLHVDFIQTIKMVDNYLPSFDMDEQMVIDKHVDKQIQKVKEQLEAQEARVFLSQQKMIRMFIKWSKNAFINILS